LHSFGQTNIDGSNPSGELVQATNGNFYGATAEGGANGYGTVFKITPNGTLTTLHNFAGTDGSYPQGWLIQATNGKLYGTTAGGGTYGGGTIFKITPNGTLATLYNFCNPSNCISGANPGPGLVQGTDRNFYGTTYLGGANKCGSVGCGTVFRITPEGSLVTLHSFDGTDGAGPLPRLVEGTDGNFYGTTLSGGANSNANDCPYISCGTVFTITPSGTLTTLYNFCSHNNCTDGGEPYAGLIQDTNGNFYGTTAYGGSKDCGCGTVFSLSVGLGPFVKAQPTSGTVGAAVNILGTNLTGTTSVTFNGTAATFTVVSASEITTTVPTGATTGTVQVVTPGGTLSSNVLFRVTQ
jgi:uncharacterized repeat protein (TIGR03803 family)